MKRWWTIVFAAVLTLGCAAQPRRSTVSDGQSPTAAVVTGVPEAKLGQTITLDDRLAVTVFTVTRHDAAADNGWIKPTKGIFLATKVEMKVLRGKTYACVCDFALVAADGSLFEPTWGVGFNDAMRSVTLNSGEKTSGLIVFDLPASALKGAFLQLRPDWTNDVHGRWTLT